MNATHVAHKQQVNNFFSLGSGTNSKTAVGLNSSIGNVSSAHGGRAVSRPGIHAKNYDSNEGAVTPKSNNTLEK